VQMCTGIRIIKNITQQIRARMFIYRNSYAQKIYSVSLALEKSRFR
jgi:hypothetical protein